MPYRKTSAYKSSTRSSYAKPSWSKPSLTVKKQSTFKAWNTQKPVTNKVIIQKTYKRYDNGYGYQPVPIIVPMGTSTVVHHDFDDDYVPYQGPNNGIGFFGFLTAVLAVAVLGAVGFVAYKRFA
jgi:hypothetical protein